MSNENQWLFPELNPSPVKPNMLLYSSCHIFQMMGYMERVRPEVRAKYNVTYIAIHLALAGDKKESPKFKEAIEAADVMLYHPLAGEKWDGYRISDFVLRKDCRHFTMESPQASCFFPVVQGTAELPVKLLLDHGWDADRIVRHFDSGNMDFRWAERFWDDSKRMMRRDQFTDLKAAEFVIRNYQTAKMFFTHNHPTGHVIAYMMDQFIGLIGEESYGEAAALMGPVQLDVGENHYPETEYEWDHYQFKFPRRYEGNMRGMEFYREQIRAICATQSAAR